jgi:hypothetical protein
MGCHKGRENLKDKLIPVLACIAVVAATATIVYVFAATVLKYFW